MRVCYRNKKMFRKEGSSSDRAGSAANFDQLMQIGVNSTGGEARRSGECEEDDDAESTSSMMAVDGGMGSHVVFKI